MLRVRNNTNSFYVRACICSTRARNYLEGVIGGGKKSVYAVDSRVLSRIGGCTMPAGVAVSFFFARVGRYCYTRYYRSANTNECTHVGHKSAKKASRRLIALHVAAPLQKGVRSVRGD